MDQSLEKIYYKLESEGVGLKDIISRNILYNFEQQPEITIDKTRKISYCKKLVLSARNTIAQKEKKEILNYIDQTLTKDKEKLGKFVFINELDVIIYNNTRKNINERDIINERSILRVIEDQNTIFKFYKNRLQRKDENNNSYLGGMVENIKENFFSNDTIIKDQDIVNITDREIKKEIEYYIIAKTINQNHIQNNKKIERCKYALYYISNGGHEDTTANIKKPPVGWISYYGPIIDDLLTETYSITTENELIFNKFNGSNNANKIDQEKVYLFEKRCKAIILGNIRIEYTLGKDIISLKETTINLSKK